MLPLLKHQFLRLGTWLLLARPFFPGFQLHCGRRRSQRRQKWNRHVPVAGAIYLQRRRCTPLQPAGLLLLLAASDAGSISLNICHRLRERRKHQMDPPGVNRVGLTEPTMELRVSERDLKRDTGLKEERESECCDCRRGLREKAREEG